MHHSKYNRSRFHKLELSFIISLSLLIALFYFYPRFEPIFKDRFRDASPDFVIIAVPRTVQTSQRVPTKPILPAIALESDELDLLDEVEIAEGIEGQSADSILVLYYPELKYRKLFEPFDASSLSATEEKDSLSQYFEYLAKRLKKMGVSGYSVFPSAEVERELNMAMGRLPFVGVTIPVNLGDLFSGASGHIYPERKLQKLNIQNIIVVHKKFDILESLWLNGSQTIFELYESDSLSYKHTFSSLQHTLDDLIINGLVEVTKIAGGKYKFKPVYSHKEMVRIVAGFRYGTPLEQNVNSEILTDILQRLLGLYL
jgi:hypothetical protein